MTAMGVLGDLCGSCKGFELVLAVVQVCTVCRVHGMCDISDRDGEIVFNWLELLACYGLDLNVAARRGGDW